jgi:hypothetical protein
MSDLDLLYQLFGLLLGLSIAEILAGLARSCRIRAGATRSPEPRIRIGWLVPLLGLLVLADQTHFWITVYELRHFLSFNYATLLGVLAMIGGYYVISTFVFPDDPSQWPNFDQYYLATNRIVIGGMMAANLGTLIYVLVAAAKGFEMNSAPISSHWMSLTAALLFFPGLVALWFVKSPRANLALLLFMNGLLLAGAVGPIVV